MLAADPPALVHLTGVASHRGIVATGRASSPTCAAASGVPLVVDAAQALGHIDCAVGRRRGLLVVAQMDGRPAWRRVSWPIRPALAQRLRRGCHRRSGICRSR